MKKEHRKYVRKERYFGQYSRSFYIGEMDEKNIEAKLEDGILNITLPKEEQKVSSKKYIEIK